MTAYLRSILLASNKAVFNVRQLPAEEYAFSLGLSAAPRLRFIKKGGEGDREVRPPFCTKKELLRSKLALKQA